jgi:hypothetical protein
MGTSPHPRGAGVIYVAFGAAYRDFAVLSILWLRRFGYTGPIRVITGEEHWPESVLQCEIIRVPKVEGFGSRYYKTRVNEYGFDTTLFLDADTLPVSSVHKLWGQLRHSDMCMPLDYHPTVGNLIRKCKVDRERRRPEYLCMRELELMGHTFYSSGVMLFRRGAETDRLFTAWQEEWARFQHEDQLAMVRALASTGSRVRTLGREWNGRIRGAETVEDAQVRGARIVHLRSGNALLTRTLLDQPPPSREDPPLWQALRFRVRRLKAAAGASLASTMKRVSVFKGSWSRRP